MAASVSPSDNELKDALLTIKSAQPSLGIAKTHALVLSSHPTWTVSEKRLRKILQNEGLIVSNAGPKRDLSRKIFPSSKVIEKLDVERWTKKVEVKYFDKFKGKGLVAKEPIVEGEVVWKEDPFVIAPEWEIFDLQKASRACEYCTTPLSGSSTIIACASSTTATPCPAHFCNRLCQSRSGRTHPLLCPAQNPASVPLIAFARKTEWMGLHAVAHCAARILLDNQISESDLHSDWRIIQGLAELGLEERFEDTREGPGAEPDRETWQKAHTLFLQAFKEPKNSAQAKKLARLIKKPLPEEISRNIFEYDAFLHGLGRMSLNMEGHGGLYTLHSHLNHSCSPSISVRHLDRGTALARITLIARRDIAQGEELVITYVDPGQSLKERRHALRAWGFGTCQCARCVDEEKAIKSSGTDALEIDDLEKELRASLGV
ncbi:hypothetical protein PLICRDRAFT_581341 [Plicaturopsis crispa FD-325 SS-3]|nr:hypothetical protein PLICRDRAFT_581341 [Plicaturopsis crispa FD-325 SS-3]